MLYLYRGTYVLIGNNRCKAFNGDIRFDVIWTQKVAWTQNWNRNAGSICKYQYK